VREVYSFWFIVFGLLQRYKCKKKSVGIYGGLKIKMWE
jgi:hypothetical protein